MTATRSAFRYRISAIAGVALLAAAAAVWHRVSPRAPVAPLYIAAPEPLVAATADQGTVTVAAAVSLAIIKVFAGLEAVYRLDSCEVNQVSAESPAKIVHAMAADEVLLTGLSNNGYRVKISRFSGDGSIIWSDTVDLPSRDAGVVIAAISERLRSGFADRPQRRGAIEPSAGAEDYSALIRIKQALGAQTIQYLPGVLHELREIRKHSPALIEAFTIEVAVASYLYRTTNDIRHFRYAEEVLGEARALAPGDPRIILAAADLCFAAGDADAVEAHLAELAGIAPHHPALVRYRARLAEMRGDGEQAIGVLEAALQDRPTVVYLRMLADIEMRQGKAEAARSHLAEAVTLAPDNLSVNNELGEMELRYGDPLRAKEILLDLSVRSPRPSVLTNLGTAALLLGEYSEAIDCYKQAMIALDSEVPVVLMNLADAYLLVGEEKAAADLYRSVANTGESPNDAETLAIKAYCQARCGDAAGAARSIESALGSAPDSPDVNYYATLVFLVANDLTGACARFERALALGMSRTWFNFPWFTNLSRCREQKEES